MIISGIPFPVSEILGADPADQFLPGIALNLFSSDIYHCFISLTGRKLRNFKFQSSILLRISPFIKQGSRSVASGSRNKRVPRRHCKGKFTAGFKNTGQDQLSGSRVKRVILDLLDLSAGGNKAERQKKNTIKELQRHKKSSFIQYYLIRRSFN